MDEARIRPDDLRRSLLDEAQRIIAEEGIEKLSLREVARRLGVSHQAPYKHFPSRDHILAEVIARAYRDFARHLADRPREDDPRADLHRMGVAYLDYALNRPLEYRLMFATPLPDPGAHPGMIADANQAFALLRDRLATMPRREGHDGTQAPPEADAIFIWSTLHGLAGILRGCPANGGPPAQLPLDILIDHVFWRMGLALKPDTDSVGG